MNIPKTAFVERYAVVGIFFLALLLSLLLAWFGDIPLRDVANRYAPMADALATGNVQAAFHPRVPLLHPLLGGGFSRLLGISGFAGVKIAGALAFALTVFPLMRLFCLIFHRETAILATFLFAICSHLLRISGSGLNDSLKGLGVALLALGAVEVANNRDKVRPYLLLGFASAVCWLAKSDMVAVTAVVFGGVFLADLLKKRIPWRTLSGCFVLLVCVSPALWINFQITGYPVPDFRFATLWMRLEALTGLTLHPAVPLGSIFSPLSIFAAVLSPSSVCEYFSSVFKGFYPYFALPALWIVVIRIRQREWTTSETILLAFLAIYPILATLQNWIFNGDNDLYISRRYILPFAPLAFGWTALAIRKLWAYSRRRFPGFAIKPLSMLLLCSVMIYDAALPTLKDYGITSKNKGIVRNSTLSLAAQIRQEFKPYRTNVEFRLDEYQSGMHPKIYAPDLPVLGYLAGGSTTTSSTQADYLVIRSTSGYDLIKNETSSAYSNNSQPQS